MLSRCGRRTLASTARRRTVLSSSPNILCATPSSSSSSAAPVRIITLRAFSSSSPSSSSGEKEYYDPRTLERVDDEVDVCIVGAGPAGLSAAIRVKQLNPDARVVLLEKGSEVGAHILSGCVLEPRALHELLGDPSTYAEKYGSAAPLGEGASKDRMFFLTEGRALPLPHPPQMSNKGNQIISLSAFTRWLAGVAEEHYGVEIYAGFAGGSLAFSEEQEAKDPWDGWKGKWGKSVTKIFQKSTEDASSTKKVHAVQGVITNDVGVAKDGTLKPGFEAGMLFRAKVTLLAEGAHGSLSKVALQKYGLRAESEPQTYGFGLKEVWRIAPEDGNDPDGKYQPGQITHTIGYPLDNQTYGGGFLYHMNNGLASLGLVLGADWKNPHRNPYKDFQTFKHHPVIKSLLTPTENFTPTRIAYGARTLNEGGLQSVPLLHFPGGALIGCAAGFVNITKIKGVHNAMKTGMLGAEGAVKALQETEEGQAADLSSYTEAFTESWVYDDLHEVRNVRPAFATPLGMWGGVAYAGVDSLFLKGRGGWTFRHTKEEDRTKYITSSPSFDASHTEPAAQHKPIAYPTFDPAISTDLLTSVSLTGTNHAEDQLSHLRVQTQAQFVEGRHGDGAHGAKESSAQRSGHVKVNTEEYAGLLARACPAGVYEYVEDEEAANDENAYKNKKLVINSQNCIHCKLCDIKTPSQDITWTVPEGGGGPKYTVT